MCMLRVEVHIAVVKKAKGHAADETHAGARSLILHVWVGKAPGAGDGVLDLVEMD